MPIACCVVGCKSRVGGQSGVHFFQLPLNKAQILSQWLIVLDRRDWIPKSSSRICSLHFSTDDYKTTQNGTRLRPDAIPSFFPDLANSEDENETITLENKENSQVSEDPKPKPANKLVLDVVANSSPATSISPSGRPRRTSKVNVKMKDFILLDDIKKHRNTAPVSSSNNSSRTDPAARALLSILEDSNSVSGDESENKQDCTPQSKAASISPSSSNLAKKSTARGSKLNSDVLSKESNENPVPLSSYSKPAPASVKRQKLLDESLEKTESLNKSENLEKSQVSPKSSKDNTNAVQKDISVVSTTKVSGKPRPKNTVPLAFRKTYFQIKEGDKVFYFSYSDLNPIVDMTKNNCLLAGESTPAIETPNSEKASPKTSPIKTVDITNEPDDIMDVDAPIESAGGNDKMDIDDNEVSSSPVRVELNKSQTKKSPKKVSFSDQTLKTDGPKPKAKRRPSQTSAKSNKTNELTGSENKNRAWKMATPQGSPLDIKQISAETPKKKRYKAVAEIVVRTDTTGEVPSVTIDEINNLVDLDGNDGKKLKKSHITLGSLPIVGSVNSNIPILSTITASNIPVLNPIPASNIPVVSQVTPTSISVINPTLKSNMPAASPTHPVKNNVNSSSTGSKHSYDNELREFSDKIVDTIKEMKLLENVNGRPSKLTVLITTLPPIKEKEILVIKKKNMETNAEQIREVQVAISSYKAQISPECGLVSGDKTLQLGSSNNSSMPILGACFEIPDVNNGNLAEETTIINDPESLSVSVPSQSTEGRPQAANASDPVPKTPEKTVLTINTDPAPEEEALDGTTVPLQHDHTYISPSLRDAETSVDDQAKDVFSKLKLSENEICYRTKVHRKLRSLKENVKRKSEAINKLKEKLKFLERALSDQRRVAKKPQRGGIVRNINKGYTGAKILNGRLGGSDKDQHETLLDNDEVSKTLEYNVTSVEHPAEFEDNPDDSEDDERTCSSPITYLCEPAIDICEKNTE